MRMRERPTYLAITLLFAASGNLHNIAKTIVTVPVEQQSKFEVVVNDKYFDVVARNTIILLIAG